MPLTIRRTGNVQIWTNPEWVFKNCVRPHIESPLQFITTRAIFVIVAQASASDITRHARGSTPTHPILDSSCTRRALSCPRPFSFASVSRYLSPFFFFLFYSWWCPLDTARCTHHARPRYSTALAALVLFYDARLLSRLSAIDRDCNCCAVV